MVNDLDIGEVHHRPATADAQAQVDVFAAESEGLIPLAAGYKDGAGHEHRGAHENFDGPLDVRIEIAPAITAVGRAQYTRPAQKRCAVQQRSDGRPAAIGDLQPAPRVAQPRPD